MNGLTVEEKANQLLDTFNGNGDHAIKCVQEILANLDWPHINFWEQVLAYLKK